MDDTSAFLMPAGDGGSIFSAVNARLAEAGIAITREDALKHAESRNEDLAELERVEFGRPAVVAIAEAVARSPLLTPDSAFDALSQLQDVFYAVRDELPVDVPDDEIIEALAMCLDGLGDASEVATMPHGEIMAFSKDYFQALGARVDDVLERACPDYRGLHVNLYDLLFPHEGELMRMASGAV